MKLDTDNTLFQTINYTIIKTVLGAIPFTASRSTGRQNTCSSFKL